MRRISSARDNAEVTTAGMPDFLSARHDLSGEGPVDWEGTDDWDSLAYRPGYPTYFGPMDDGSKGFNDRPSTAPAGQVDYDKNYQPTRGLAWPAGYAPNSTDPASEIAVDLPPGLEPDEAHAEVEKSFPEGSGGEPAYRGRHRASFSDHIDEDGNVDWDAVNGDKDDSEEEE